MYKVTNGLSPEIINEIFQIREEPRCNFRYTSQFTIPSIHSVYNSRESVSFMNPKIWNLIPPAFKQVKSLSGFKKKQLRNGSLVTAQADFAKRIDHKLVS